MGVVLFPGNLWRTDLLAVTIIAMPVCRNRRTPPGPDEAVVDGRRLAGALVYCQASGWWEAPPHRIPPLELRILLESNPPKSRILVQRLAVELLSG